MIRHSVLYIFRFPSFGDLLGSAQQSPGKKQARRNGLTRPDSASVGVSSFEIVVALPFLFYCCYKVLFLTPYSTPYSRLSHSSPMKARSSRFPIQEFPTANARPFCKWEPTGSGSVSVPQPLVQLGAADRAEDRQGVIGQWVDDLGPGRDSP
jgi:hypothetical protein